MYNSILLSTQPQFSQLIFVKKIKTKELRSRVPVKVPNGGKAIVYESFPTQGAVGYFTISEIIKNTPSVIWNAFKLELAISEEIFNAYCTKKRSVFVISIKNPTLFKRVVPLDRLRIICNFSNPPQNFRYLSSEEHAQILKYAK